MTRARRAIRQIGLGLMVLGTAATCQPAATEAAEAPEAPAAPEKARRPPQRALMSLPVHRIFVHRIARLQKPVDTIGADSVDWSAANNRLLVGKLGLNRFYTVYTMTPEGFLGTPRTSGMPNSTKVHCGAASWHPDGNYFLFTSQKPFIPHHSHSVPSIGWHCDLWLANGEGTDFWQLTNETSSRSAPKGVTDPHFSSDGTRVVWSGNTGKVNRSPWYEKSLYVGDFSMAGGEPKVANVRGFQPGETRDFYEAYGFSPDDNRVLFAANVLRGTPWYDLDVCVFDRRDKSMHNLTKSPKVWDRFATYSPDGKKIIWTSSQGISIPYLGLRGENWPRYMQSELWIMDADGRQAKQLTFFNRKGHPHYQERRVFLGDAAFSPDGRQIAVVMYKEKHNFEPESEIIMLTLGDGPAPVVKQDTTEKPTRPLPPKPEVKKPEPPKKDDKRVNTIDW